MCMQCSDPLVAAAAAILRPLDTLVSEERDIFASVARMQLHALEDELQAWCVDAAARWRPPLPLNVIRRSMRRTRP